MGLISSVSSRTYSFRKMLRATLKFCRVTRQTSVRSAAAAAVAVDGAPQEFSPSIVELVDKIGSLTILEVSQLNTLMKQRFNLSDVAVAAPMAAGAAPVAAAAPAAEAQPEEEEEEAPAFVQTEFTVKLKKFDPKSKIKIIKQLKTSIPGINLVEAKKMAEGAPCDIKKDIPKDEADELKAVFEKLGAEMEVL